MPNVRKTDGASSPRHMTGSYLMERHLQERKSLAEIARECGCTRQSVYLKMKELGVPLRSGHAPRVITIEEEKHDRSRTRHAGTEAGAGPARPMAEDFFRTWTPAMTYVLGVLCTAGTVVTNRLSIQHGEPELLEKVLSLMNCPSRILRSPQRSYGRAGDDHHAVHIEDDAICRDLLALGVAPHRGLPGFPAVPADMTRHFLRGCWDGAGTVAMHGQQLRASFVSGSKAFISGLVGLLYDIGIHRDRLLRTSSSLQDLRMMRAEYPAGQYPLNISVGLRSNAPSYGVKMDSPQHLQRLFCCLYAGVGEAEFLRSRYEVFVGGLRISGDMQQWLRTYHEDLNLPPAPPIPVRRGADMPDPAA